MVIEQSAVDALREEIGANISDDLAARFVALVPELYNTDAVAHPELANTERDVKFWLGIAKTIHNIDPSATVYCAAHLLTVQIDQQGGGDPNDVGAGVGSPGVDSGHQIVQSEQMGKHTITYATTVLSTAGDLEDAASHTTFFSQTIYGRLFLMLERRATPPIGFRVI